MNYALQYTNRKRTISISVTPKMEVIVKAPKRVSKKEIDFSTYNFSGLFDRALSDIKIDKKIFYIGKFSGNCRRYGRI